MNGLLEQIGAATTGLPAFLLEVGLKSSVLLLCAAGFAIAWRRGSAAARHLVWMSAVAGALMLPALVATLPEWSVLPALEHARPTQGIGGVDTLPSRHQVADGSIAQVSAGAVVATEDQRAVAADIVMRPATSASGSLAAPPTSAASTQWWSGLVVLVWVSGALLVLMRLVVSWLWLARRACRGETDTSPELAAALEESLRAVGAKTPVRLLIGADALMPMAWGIRRPTILLPAGAVGWPRSRLSAVLLHELAHVRRRDPLWQLIVELGRAAYWCHPLYWLAAWRVHVERERACDDLVVSRGYRAADYAQHLVEIVSRLGLCPPAAGVGIAMAGSRRIEGRVRAILDESRDRRGVTALQNRLGLGIALAFCIVVAMAASAPGDDVKRDVAKAATAAAETDPQIRRIHELIYILRQHTVFERCDEWASAIRELAQIGKPAVPELVAELDRAERNETLRGVAFTLRAIGDPRAVPALIRNIPKALQPPGSDCGVQVTDPELMAFMLAHDNSVGFHKRHPEITRQTDNFHYGRPVNEILSALEMLTGHMYPDDQHDHLRRVMLSGTEEQRAEQRTLFAERQAHWEEWWNEHQSEIVSAEELASLGPPRDNDAAIDAAGVAKFGVLFPVGRDVRLTPAREVTLGLGHYWNAISHFDLDSGREFEFGEGLIGSKQFPHVEWTVQSGVDVRCFGVLQGEDLHAWLIDNGRWDTIDEEVRSGMPLKLGPETSEHLVPFRQHKGDFQFGETGTFLFTTREGGRGILQAFPRDPMTSSRRFRYRMWESQAPIAASSLKKSLPETSTPFGEPLAVTLDIPKTNARFLYDLDDQSARALPDNRELDAYFYLGADSEAATREWASQQGIDFAVYSSAVLGEGASTTGDSQQSVVGLQGLGMRNQEITPESFETLTVEAAGEVIDRVVVPQEWAAYFMPHMSESQANEPATYVFRTRTGRLGLLQITTPAGPSETISFRVRMEPE